MDRPSQGEPEPERVPESDPVPVSQADQDKTPPSASEPPPAAEQNPVSAPAPDSGSGSSAGAVSESASVSESAPDSAPVPDSGSGSASSSGPVAESAPAIAQVPDSDANSVPSADPAPESAPAAAWVPGSDSSSVSSVDPAPEAPPASASPAESGSAFEPTVGRPAEQVTQPGFTFASEQAFDRTQPVTPAPPADEPITVAQVDPTPGYQTPTYQPGQGYQGQAYQGYPAGTDSGSWQAQPGADYQSGEQPGYPGTPVFQPTTDYGYQAPTGYQPVSVFQVPAPPKERPRRDPLAVALGNASLLSAGYWLLGRRVLALATTAVTVGLILVLALVVKTLWFELVVVAWWLALIVHGWFLAGGKLGLVPKPDARKHRLIALGMAVVVLAAFGLLRYDSARIGQDVTAARDAGSCADATEALGSRWFGHRVANAPLALEGDDTVRACELIGAAEQDFETALTGDTKALQAGFGDLTTVVEDLPGHEKMVGAVVDQFLEELPVEDNCVTATLTEALAARKDGGVLDRADDTVAKVAPEALVGCGDDLLASQTYEEARDRYQQLLDDYPDHELAPKATEGVTKATQAIELAHVRSLMQTTSGTQPAYCNSPAPYSGAPPYAHPGPTPAITFGNEEYTAKLPWRVTDVANAVTVICAGETQHGNAQETCPYESSFAVGGAVDVTFFRIAVPVRMYEVRTGKLLADTIIEIGGASCPDVLEYSTYISDLGPPSETYVTATDADVQNGFRWLFFP